MAWAEFYTQGSYYLATAADRRCTCSPRACSTTAACRAEYMFLKGLFEKLDIDMQFIRGSNNKFKSFGEV
ncbi:MAG: S49 family peptidase [Flavobacteriales bacterium]|nr:S49 family peptidase [Flavobacteriales bacterium]